MLKITISLACSLSSLFYLCQPSQASPVETKLISLGSKGIRGIEMYVDLNSRARVSGGFKGEGFTVYEVYSATGELFPLSYFVSCSNQTIMEFKDDRVPLPAFSPWQKNLLSIVCQDMTQGNKSPQKEESPKPPATQNPSPNSPQNPKPLAISETGVERDNLPTSPIQLSPIQPIQKVPGISISEAQIQTLRERLSRKFKVSSSTFKNIDVRDAMLLQSSLQKSGFRSTGSRLLNGKLVKRGDTMELPTMKALRAVIESELSNLRK